MIEIEVLLTEQRLTEEFLLALERRYLAEKFFYWFPLSVKAWLDLCGTDNPYKNYSRSYQLVARHAAEIARRTSRDGVEVVGLGAGQGDKDLLVLEALRFAGRPVRYRPLDSSQALLEIAVARAQAAGFRTGGLKADAEAPCTFEVLAGSGQGPRLYALLGNSLGVIDPLSHLEALRKLLHPDDLLLLDGEIYNPQTTIQGYDHPTNRQFAFAPLSSLGLLEGRDGALVFGTETDPRVDGLHRVSKHFCAARRLKIPVAGKWVELEEREKISMNSSWKYTREAFHKIVRETGKFEFLGEYMSEDGGFLMALVRPTGDPSTAAGTGQGSKP